MQNARVMEHINAQKAQIRDLRIWEDVHPYQYAYNRVIEPVAAFSGCGLHVASYASTDGILSYDHRRINCSQTAKIDVIWR